MVGDFVLPFRSQGLRRDPDGYLGWGTEVRMAHLAPERTALVLCDVWDRHWCRGASERLEGLLPRMNLIVGSARRHGLLVVHAPSDTMEFYADSPARQRVLDASPVEPPADLPHDDPPLPIDAADGGCDTDQNVGSVHETVWTRQHPAIYVDSARDAISDSGRELYNLYRQCGVRNILIAGVHANMCILNRSFAIKQMVRWGFVVALIRDLTDSMYHSGLRPYVSHTEGTRLTVAFIEKFWCPTISSDDLLYALGGQ